MTLTPIAERLAVELSLPDLRLRSVAALSLPPLRGGKDVNDDDLIDDDDRDEGYIGVLIRQ